jgi:hypothetical protein
MHFQLIFKKISKIVFEEKNIFFLENFYYKCYTKIKKLLDLKIYDLPFQLSKINI